MSFDLDRNSWRAFQGGLIMQVAPLTGTKGPCDPTDAVKSSLQPKDANIQLYHFVVPPLEQPTDDSNYDYIRQSKDNIKIFERIVSQLDEQNKQ